MLVADVAVPVPLARAFSYEVPQHLAPLLVPGARVLCDFRKRQTIGVVVGLGEREPSPDLPLKPLRAVVDARPVVPKELLDFLLEVAGYYYAPIGEVLRMALPALERGEVERLEDVQGELGTLKRTKQIGEARELVISATDSVEEPGTLRGQAREILALVRGTGPQVLSRLEDRFKNARSAAKKLASLGLAKLEQRARAHAPLFAELAERDTPPELTTAQAEATARVTASIRGESTERGFLLFGVTGSGKTEVYLRAIAACLEVGKGALVMVPEIALTPQLVGRFRARFGDDLAVVHSGLSDKARHAMHKKLLAGEVKVAIGARSALFAPVPSLGLVIVDEEHDGSFKQEEGVRYHARDMAILRAHRAGATIVLGSATPSLESFELSRKGKLTLLRLPDRAKSEASLPVVEVIDLKRFGAGPTGDPLLSLPLHRALEATLAKKEQAILFLNRRGHSPTIVCMMCGTVHTCKACSVSLTFHRGRGGFDSESLEGGRVRCHYCGYEDHVPDRCEKCGSRELLLEGLGTEKLEQTLAEAFPAATIARLDRDVAEGGKSEKLLSRMRAGEIDILVGTQMVTKGHDYPNVTMVGVVNADAALSMPDFRSGERSFSLLVQVAGRAGRHERPGRVIIQTRNPEHPAIVLAARHDVEGFLRSELKDRAEVHYPPFAKLALLRIEAIDARVAQRTAGDLARACMASAPARAGKVDVLGPSPAPLARLRARYRFRVLLRATDRGPLRACLAAVEPLLSGIDRRARALIDVDPVSMM
ncbi:MAG: primosomal protein N' [Myxococcales bacterium]|nr:primosomal protein N' [Myxococcales bacterium]